MFVYQIENVINKKKYIGSTNNPQRRKEEHFNAAKWKSCQSYNYPLQQAIRKYGEEYFIFSIIEECDDKIISEREKFYITLFNSLANEGWGYNQTIETKCALQDPEIIKANVERQGQKCALVDNKNKILKKFNSYHEAAREICDYGNNSGSIVRKVCKGELHSIKDFIFRDLDDNENVIEVQNKTRKRKTAIYGVSIDDPNDIVYYESVSEAARQEGVDRCSISKCIAGSTRYSHVKKRKWRKVGDD